MTREQRIELMAERHANGLDIFSGEPLPAEVLEEMRREDELSEIRSRCGELNTQNVVNNI